MRRLRSDDRGLPAALRIFIALALLASAGDAAGEGVPGSLAGCAEIADDAARLECYDALAGRGASPEAAIPPGKVAGEPSGDERPSRLARLWELDAASRREGFAITPYRFNYFLPYTYNGTPNNDPLAVPGSGTDVQNQEIKFQISFKTKLWQDIMGRKLDLWLAYTQLSFWQFYDFDNSAPFRETDYEPEMLLNLRTDFDLLGFRGRYVGAGFNHQSNGRTRPQSRSWNRIVANVGFERGDFDVVLNAWYRLPESAEDDDNPHLDRYLGHGRIDLGYLWKGHRFGLVFRNNLRTRGNKGAVQLDWCFPLIQTVSGYVQYFNGYGESLLDYRASSNRIGAGFILKEW